jgi:hypothetical protein
MIFTLAAYERVHIPPVALCKTENLNTPELRFYILYLQKIQYKASTTLFAQYYLYCTYSKLGFLVKCFGLSYVLYNFPCSCDIGLYYD